MKRLGSMGDKGRMRRFKGDYAKSLSHTCETFHFLAAFRTCHGRIGYEQAREHSGLQASVIKPVWSFCVYKTVTCHENAVETIVTAHGRLSILYLAVRHTVPLRSR